MVDLMDKELASQLGKFIEDLRNKLHGYAVVDVADDVAVSVIGKQEMVIQ